ncbi:hypothetical protein ACSCBZ_24730 [Streptomyces niveiscabiei]|uniref:hypothetical protein n=1 Tax=Streptomyces niveiscabiei TaxID=164115 RepID=UPI0006EB3972|nr:hypothetical protein [Streptomyces niveiscabiei]
MSQPTTDARAVVRAIDALTTQVRRVADALQTPVDTTPDEPTTPTDDDRVTRLTEMLTGVRPKPMDPVHILGAESPTDPDTCRSIEVDGETISVRGSGDFTERDATFFREIVRAAKRRYETESSPADDEDAPYLLRVLVDRAARGVLSLPGEGEALRRRVEQIINGRETWKGNAEHIEQDRDRIARHRDHLEELLRTETARANAAIDREHTAEEAAEEAQAAIERVRAVGPDPLNGHPAAPHQEAYVRGWSSAIDEVQRALDDTDPTT